MRAALCCAPLLRGCVLTVYVFMGLCQVAEYIKNRDGLKEAPNPDHIFLTGAWRRRAREREIERRPMYVSFLT